MKSQVGTKFSYVMRSCQFVRFVKPLGSKSKGLWRTVYLASPSRQVCFSLFIGQFICSFLFDFHFVRLFSFFFTCIPVGRTATNFASQFFFFSHYSGFGFLIIISNRFITLSFTCTSDEEREAKPKKRRKRTKELPKEDSSDDGNNDVNTFNMLCAWAAHVRSPSFKRNLRKLHVVSVQMISVRPKFQMRKKFLSPEWEIILGNTNIWGIDRRKK